MEQKKKRPIRNQASNSLHQNLHEHGKVPPQAIDLEEAVLGICLIENGAYDKIAHILNPECFYRDAHQRIFKAIEILSSRAEPIDGLTVANELKTLGELESVGGPYYMTTLTSRVSSSVNIEQHAYIIYQKHIHRQIVNKCGELVRLAYEDDYDLMRATYASATDFLDNLLAGKRADKNMLQILKDHAVELDRRAELYKNGKMVGIRTGLVDLDRSTNGWKAGNLIIVAARPSMGKTAVALNMFTKSAAVNNHKTLFFSLEMDDLSLADRLICSYGGVDPNHLKQGNLNEVEWSNYHNASTQLLDLPISIDDSARVDLKHITAISRAKRRKGDCDMVVIDYLQLIEMTQEGYHNKTREREVAETSRGLKMLAKELGIPVILLCQLSRAVESRGGNKQPMLSDLRESGAIEQDADMVIFPYRPEYYGITEDDNGTSTRGMMILDVAKNRDGRCGPVYAKYSPDLTQFFDFNHDQSPI